MKYLTITTVHVCVHYVQESEEKIKLLEERVIEERQKGQSSKKDQADLIRSHKAEIKSLLEKVEKLVPAALVLIILCAIIVQ